MSSDRQDVDLSVAAQLRALRDYADKNGYTVAREYVDEAESGRIADRPQFRRMLDEASKPDSPFREILVWKFSRFTRKRNTPSLSSPCCGARASGWSPSPSTPTTPPLASSWSHHRVRGRVLQRKSCRRGPARNARGPSRGFWVASRVPYGYRKVYVQDGAKKRPTLEPDPDTSPVVQRIFNMAEAGHGILDITRTLNGEGIANPTGRLWSKNGVHIILRNEAYTGTLVWAKAPRTRASRCGWKRPSPPSSPRPSSAGSTGRCAPAPPSALTPAGWAAPTCSAAWSSAAVAAGPCPGQDSKGGKFAYYVCQSLMKRGSGACDCPRLNARRFEEMVVGKIRENVLTESNIRELVKLVDEEMDGIAREQRQRLETAEAELLDVKRRLERLYDLARDHRLGHRGLQAPHQGPPGAPGASRGRGGGGQSDAFPAPGRAGRRGDHRRLLRGPEQVSERERAYRASGLSSSPS